MLTFLRRVRYLIRRRTVNLDLTEEIETHRLMIERQLRDSGMSAAEAAAASRRLMGNITLAREDARAAWLGPGIESLWADVRFAMRALRRAPGFTLAVVVVLTAAIGLNTTLFTVFNAVAVKQWPVADPDRVVTIHNASARELKGRAGGAPGGFSLEEIAYFGAHSRTLTGLVAIRSGGGDQTLGEDDTPAQWVSANYFSSLGVSMAHGRGFLPDEDRVDSPAAVAVLSHGYWARAYGRNPSIVGDRIRLEDVSFTVVGVAGAEFTGTSPDRTDIWLPLAAATILRPNDRWTLNVLLKPESCCLQLAGRMAAGVTRDQARAELAVLDRQYRSVRGREQGSVTVAGTEFAADPKTDATPLFMPMSAAVLLVLVLACANVSNLLLARAAARRREIAVRLSLGASRWRLVRQLLVESLVLAVTAGVGGLFLASWAPERVMTLLSPSFALRLAPDGLVLAFALGLSLAACMLFGLLPALHGTHSTVVSALKSGPVLRLGGIPIRNMLLSVQVAIAVLVTLAAGLLTRAVQDAHTRALGFTKDGVSVVSFQLPPSGLDAQRTRALSLQLAADLEPLVAAGRAALTSTAPMASGNIKGTFRLPGNPQEEFNNSVYEVSPGYFEFLEMPIVSGRSLTGAAKDQQTIVINETMARRYWPSGTAVGQRIVVDARSGGWNRAGELLVIGVARDAAMNSLTSVDATIYEPLSGRSLPQVLVRDDGVSIRAVRETAAAVDGSLRVTVRALADNLAPKVRPSRVAAIMAGLLAGLALLLASAGLAGVVAYVVQQRTHEIGVRMALGARAGEVVRLIMGSSAWPVLGGASAGFAASFPLSRVLESHLLGLSRMDPAAYVVVAVVLAAAGAGAAFVPARRATRIYPVDALRCE